MARCVVVGASVVVVDALACARLLYLPLSRDGMAAVGALNQVARIGERVRLINVVAQEHLNTIPGCPFDQWRLLAGIPLAPEHDFADVRPVLQNVVDRTAGKT